MTTKKHFVAINNETGERIEFGVEDIRAFQSCYPEQWLGIGIGCDKLNQTQALTLSLCGSLLSNHTLYYLHEGKYYNYETGKEMV